MKSTGICQGTKRFSHIGDGGGQKVVFFKKIFKISHREEKTGCHLLLRGTSEKLSLKTQKGYLRRYAKGHGYDLLEYYLDNRYSGLNYDRPTFSRLEANVQAEHIRAIIVHDATRIGRNVLETAHWIEQLRKRGIPFLKAVIDLKPVAVRLLLYR